MRQALLQALKKRLWTPYRATWRTIDQRWYRGHEYTLHVPLGYRTLTPWFATDSGSEFAADLKGAESGGPFIWELDRAYMLHQFGRSCVHLTGPMAECGVFAGGTAHMLALMLERAGSQHELHLFDTFEGMPPSTDPARDCCHPGDFYASRETVEQRLAAFPFVRFHPGLIPQSLEEVRDIDGYSFVHVNLGAGPATLDCCRWFWPRMRDGGVMFFGECGLHGFRHASRAAVEEFFTQVGESPISLPSGQAAVIKR